MCRIFFIKASCGVGIICFINEETEAQWLPFVFAQGQTIANLDIAHLFTWS